MSDERDETRQFAAFGEPTRADGPPKDGETPPRRPGDDTVAGPPPPQGDDRTVTEASPLLGDDRTVAGASPLRGEGGTVAGNLPRPGPDDTTAGALPPVRGESAGAHRRPDATAIMPPVTDEWAPSRANPAWSGRAEVRAPLPGRPGYEEVDDWSGGMPGEPRTRWWMPIVVGIVVLILLAVLGWGIYLIVQNTGRATPVPTTPPSAAPARVVEPTPTPTAAATTAPTTAPATTLTTPEPTAEVTIPALRGLSLPEAQAALTRTGLRWRVIEIADEAPAGTVVDSDPAEGQEVPPATRVTLVVAAATTTAPTATSTTTTR